MSHQDVPFSDVTTYDLDTNFDKHMKLESAVISSHGGIHISVVARTK